MDESEIEVTDGGREYIEDIEDGAGCVEIWERLSELREEDGSKKE